MSYSYNLPVDPNMKTESQKRRELEEARNKQQTEHKIRASEFAVKQKQKEKEKIMKKIAAWERLGRDIGKPLGGSKTSKESEDESRQAILAARERMQQEHDMRITHAKQCPSLEQVNAEKKKIEREEKLHLQKIEKWERLNGNIRGQRVGDQVTVLDHVNIPQTKASPSATVTSNCNCTNEFNESSDPANTLPMTEEQKREEMKAARMKMQREYDLKISQQQGQKQE